MINHDAHKYLKNFLLVKILAAADFSLKFLNNHKLKPAATNDENITK